MFNGYKRKWEYSESLLIKLLGPMLSVHYESVSLVLFNYEYYVEMRYAIQSFPIKFEQNCCHVTIVTFWTLNKFSIFNLYDNKILLWPLECEG